MQNGYSNVLRATRNKTKVNTIEKKKLEKSKTPDRTDKLICNFCRDDGFTPRDTHVYYCSLCGPTKRKGRAKFDADWKSL